ncbi:MAG: acyl-[acyl-carrier-protein]--UDP-N-acetylglucosamine O-acyltransferase [Deltaproteobacteria bacterium]|nr:MAG: acyl-[acyl-carrier-protein]--UDP-N-acetylglucosamine O-acyltransferase [Deltaproteobacteria bacterium]
MATEIHPSALVAQGAELGQDVVIGPFAIVEKDTRIGDRSIIDASAHIKTLTTLGEDCHIHSFASIGGPPQDLKYHGERTLLEMADRITVREFVTINRGTTGGGGITRVGSDCFVMAYCHIAHDCQLEDHVIMSNGATLAGHVEVAAHAIIGGLSAVHQFVRIGTHAFIGGKTGVAQDIPPYMMAAGDRARLRGPNLIGLKRAGFTRDELKAIKQAYKLIWRTKGNFKGACRDALTQFGDVDKVAHLVDFITTSQRGVTSAV